MRLYEESEDYKLQVHDIETLAGLFYVGFYNIDTEEYIEFEISRRKNDLYRLVKFYDKSNTDYAIGYNNLGFDAQVLEYIIRNYKYWPDKSAEEIVTIIYRFVQRLIENGRYNIRKPFYDSELSIKQLDVFTILGLDNEARRTSLKSLEFALDMESVETMPIHHSKKDLTNDEMDRTIGYCKVDIIATATSFKLVLGDTKHPLYKGVNQLALRHSIQEEFGLNCINMSDIRIGDELMKLTYAKAIKKKISDLPFKGTFRKSIKLAECIPKYIEFKTPTLQNLLDKLKRTSLKTREKWEEKVNINGTTHIQALGGLHSVNKNEIYKSTDEISIITADVSSMYPASIVENGYYPSHLGPELLNTYKSLFNRRLELKPQAKNNSKIKGIVDALKLVCNSIFGKLGSPESWLYDKKAMLSVTLSGQYAVLMLIEELELANFKVIISNTDGYETIVPNKRKYEYSCICKAWEKKTNYTLEYDEYSCIYMSNVNNYLAITTSGKVKKKGWFVTEYELWKDKSMLIRSLALEQYFVNKVRPEDFIRNYKNVYDFCIRGKANGDDYMELVFPNGRKEKVGNLVRYYVTTNKECPQIFKMTSRYTSLEAENELGIRKIQIFNKFEEKEDYQIDYNHYIYETYRVIAQLEGNKKDEDFLKSTSESKQISLFN